MAVIYSGGESSRIYTEQVSVRAWFHWPWGQPGEHDTAPMPYEDAMNWLAAAPYTPLLVTDSDTGEVHDVRIERAVIVEP